jgi:hypothetical protein
MSQLTEEGDRVNLRFPLRKALVLTVLALVLAGELTAVVLTNLESGLPFLYFLGGTLLMHRLTVGKNWIEPLVLYLFYSGLIIATYYIQYTTFPEFYGFTPASVAGTDDSYFYSLVADYLPSDFPVRGDYYLRDHTYAILIRTVTPFAIRHPFDVLFFNAVGAAFIPIYSRMLALEVTQSRRVAKLAFGLVLLCPFLMTYSLVLVRDGWTAALFAGAIVFFLQRKFGRFVLLSGVLFFLRIASGLQLMMIVGLLGLLLFRKTRSTSVKLALVLGVLGAGGFVLYAVYPVLIARAQALEAGSILGLLFRDSFLMALQSMAPGSFLIQIYQQPFYIRIPASFLFFTVFPFFTPSELFVEGRFVWRALLKCAYSILFVVYFKFLIQGVVAIFENKKNEVLVYTFLGLCLIVLFLSQASMQIRHKTMIMPLMYLVVAHGYYESSKIGRQLGWFGLFVLASLNVLKFIIGV